MEPPFRGYGDFGRSEEEEQYRPPPFDHRPPPPPPPEDEEGGRYFGGRRDEYEEGGFPGGGERRYGRREDEEGERFGREDEGGFGRRRGGEEGERFGREDFEGGFGHRRGEDGDGGFGHRRGEDGEGGFGEGGFGHRKGEDGEGGFGRRLGEESEQFGRAGDEERHPPEHHSHFPHLGFHRGGHHGGDPPQSEEPAADSSLSNKMGSLSIDLPQGRLVRIFCKGDGGYNVAVAHNNLQMQDSNTDDESQHWIKDATHGMRIKDSYGYPAFTLINKKTGKMLKHADEQGQQVLLVDYDAELKDDSVLWTESQEFGEGFKTVRAASDTLLNLTIFEGHKKIRNGSALVLDTWHKGDHQLWKLFPL